MNKKSHFINLKQDINSITNRMEFVVNHRSEILSAISGDFNREEMVSLTRELRDFVLVKFGDRHSVLTALCLQVLVDGILAEEISFEIVGVKN